MHERRSHVHTSLGRGVGNVTAVIWRDLVEVREIFFHPRPHNCLWFQKMPWIISVKFEVFTFSCHAQFRFCVGGWHTSRCRAYSLTASSSPRQTHVASEKNAAVAVSRGKHLATYACAMKNLHYPMPGNPYSIHPPTRCPLMVSRLTNVRRSQARKSKARTFRLGETRLSCSRRKR